MEICTEMKNLILTPLMKLECADMESWGIMLDLCYKSVFRSYWWWRSEEHCKRMSVKLDLKRENFRKLWPIWYLEGNEAYKEVEKLVIEFWIWFGSLVEAWKSVWSLLVFQVYLKEGLELSLGSKARRVGMRLWECSTSFVWCVQVNWQM